MLKLLTLSLAASALVSAPLLADGPGRNGGGGRSGGYRPAPSRPAPSRPSYGGGGYRSPAPGGGYRPTNPGRAPSSPGSYRPTNPGRPSNPGSYRPTNPGRPSSPGGYRPTNPGSPTSPGGYRPTNPGRPSNPGGYRPTNPGRPSNPGGYRPTNPGRPSNPGNYRPGPGRPTNPGSYTPRVVTRGNTRYNYDRAYVNNRYVVQRTHYQNGARVVRHYSPYNFGRHTYYGYQPYRYYNPWYYGWATTYWSTPYSHQWRWHNDPWYGHYSYYYRPYPVYYGPSYWLLDYLLADLLAQQYAYAYGNTGSTPYYPQDPNTGPYIDDQLKDQLRGQVETSVRNQGQQQPTSIGDALSDLRHIFVVSQDLSVTRMDDNSACALSSGDLLRLIQVPSQDDQFAMVSVVTAKQGSCQAGSQVYVAISTLQDFENDFSEQVEEGMGKMSTELSTQLPSRDVGGSTPGFSQQPPLEFQEDGISSDGASELQ